MPTESERNDILLVLDALLNGESWDDTRLVLFDHRSVVDSGAAAAALQHMLPAFAGDPKADFCLREAIDVVESWVRDGPDVVFDGRLRFVDPERDALELRLAAIAQLTRNGDWQAVAATCAHAQRMVRPTTEPYDWAILNGNAGIAQLNHGKDTASADHLRLAIAHFRRALWIFTEQDDMGMWAGTHNNIGNAYACLAALESNAHIATAKTHYELAMRETSFRESHPLEWASAVSHLAAFALSVDDPPNPEMAVDYYTAALAALDPTTHATHRIAMATYAHHALERVLGAALNGRIDGATPDRGHLGLVLKWWDFKKISLRESLYLQWQQVPERDALNLNGGDKLPRLTPHTCWLVGAGASFDAVGPAGTGGYEGCVPLAAQIALDLPADMIRRIARLPPRRPSEPLAPDQSLATLLRSLEQSTSSSDAATATEARDCLDEVLGHISKCVSTTQARVRPPRGYGKFGFRADNILWLASRAHHAEQWSIVSLNYDTLLDTVFQQISRGDPTESPYDRWLATLDAFRHDRARGDRNAGLYIKVRGSIDMYHCIDSSCAETGKVILPDSGTFEQAVAPSRVPTHRPWTPACRGCGRPTLPLALWSGMRAGAAERYQREMLGHAERALAHSDTWMLVGYSCPQEDGDVLQTLARAAQHTPASGARRHINVLAPDAVRTAAALTNALGQPVRPVATTFTDFVTCVLEIEGHQRPLDSASALDGHSDWGRTSTA
jgi:hypothetical protein